MMLKEKLKKELLEDELLEDVEEINVVQDVEEEEIRNKMFVNNLLIIIIYQ
jgi:hypothetical protein